MSTYEYTYRNRAGLALHVSPFDEAPGEIWVSTDKNAVFGVYIPNTDVPTVAAELLKAAGQEGVFVAKALDEVRVHENGVLECGDGPEYADALTSSNPNWLRNRAANCIALAEYIENRARRETEAATKLQERREGLWQELGCDLNVRDVEPGSPFAKAIDRIIELEDKQAA